jgi:ankyrin repeat protein
MEAGIDIFVKNGVGDTAIHYAIYNGTDMVQYLISLGLDLNCTNDLGYRPIDYASIKGDFNCINFILDYHKSHSISVNSKKKQVESLSNTELASQILKCDMGRLMNECNIKELLMKNSLLSQSEQEFLLKKIN